MRVGGGGGGGDVEVSHDTLIHGGSVLYTAKKYGCGYNLAYFSIKVQDFNFQFL